MNVRNTSRKALIVLGAVLTVAAGAWWSYKLHLRLRQSLDFDDAYMFWRYARNVRHGFGVSWNLDGVHTYGQTALLWAGVVWLLTFFSGNAPAALVVASWISSVMAIAATSLVIQRNARSALFRSIWCVIPCVALPLLHSILFVENSVSGMETMLAAALTAIFVGFALSWQRNAVPAIVPAAAGYLLFLTRPEAALIVVLLPAMLVVPHETRRLANLLGLFFVFVCIHLTVCWLYFHTPVPLSFYVKSSHGYQGYARNWTPVFSAYDFFRSCKYYLVLLVVFARPRTLRLNLACLLSLAVTFLYLTRTIQIMGFYARYYVPYFALVVIPALLCADDLMHRFDYEALRELLTPRLALRSLTALFVFFALQNRTAMRAVFAADRRMAGKIDIYTPVMFDTEAKLSPTTPGKRWIFKDVGDILLAPLPRGASIAATEVGYLGYAASQVDIIDIAGLNDTTIALHGFNMDALLARRPDIIWFPHPDYTWQRGEMFTDPALLEQYDLYAEAASFGIAIRKDSPFHRQIEDRMDALWQTLYPGAKRADDLVVDVRWTGQTEPLSFHQATLGLAAGGETAQ